MKEFGIDISEFQGRFNMALAKEEGVKYCIIKCGGADAGLYRDPEFEYNYSQAKKNGIPCGVYFLARAESEARAREEADWCYEIFLRGKQLELPVWYDVENRRQMSIGRKKLTSVILAFCDQMAKHGFMAGVYSSGSYFEGYMDDSMLKDIPHWVAQYHTEFQYENLNSVGIWQYGGSLNFIRSNKVAGVVCDQDYMFTDYESIIKGAKLNGWGDAPSKTVDELAEEVWAGMWGNGEERKDRLTAAGYDYEAVQNRVEETAADHMPKPEPEKEKLHKGDAVKIEDGATFWSGDKVASWIIAKTWIVYEDQTGDRIVINESTDGKNKIMSPIDVKFLHKVDAVAPDLKPIEEVAKEVIRGDWGNGEERKNRLEAAGYDYAEVQGYVDSHY